MFVGQSYLLSFTVLSLHLHQTTNICLTGIIFLMMIGITVFDKFALVSIEELIKIISVMNKTTCASDPFPTKLLMNHLPAVIDIILHIVNLAFPHVFFHHLVNILLLYL